MVDGEKEKAYGLIIVMEKYPDMEAMRLTFDSNFEYANLWWTKKVIYQ